jgi:hypothetical protein
MRQAGWQTGVGIARRPAAAARTALRIQRPEQLIDEVLGYLADGYTASKMRIGSEWSWDGVTVDRFLGLMREVAQAVRGACS